MPTDRDVQVDQRADSALESKHVPAPEADKMRRRPDDKMLRRHQTKERKEP